MRNPDYVPSETPGCKCNRVGPWTFTVDECPIHGAEAKPKRPDNPPKPEDPNNWPKG